MKEGEKLKGLWQPLAAATIAQLLLGVMRALGAKGVEIPSIATFLECWALPMTAEAFKVAEEETRANNLFDFVNNLAEKQKGGK